MNTPERDAAPGGPQSFDSIEVDLRGMKEYADLLRAELQNSYLPHRRLVSADMLVPSAPPVAEFDEFVTFLQEHRRSQVLTAALLTAHANATNAFSEAAEIISRSFGDADGLARARARDVEKIMAEGRHLSGEA